MRGFGTYRVPFTLDRKFKQWVCETDFNMLDIYASVILFNAL